MPEFPQDKSAITVLDLYIASDNKSGDIVIAMLLREYLDSMKGIYVSQVSFDAS